VEELLRGRQAQRITTKREFFQELAQGESDLLILVAHSTGSQLYLNGKKTSIKELQELPARTHRAARPRLAILVSCDAGKPETENSGSWMTRLRGEETVRESSSVQVNSLEIE
jgi:hypothetical protein